ncbi:alpha carbonic anhydrase 7-like [Prunus avium]|uniref:Carbonic anhydrase n=1 Tax=Prunus avium TaxID=42229 RepID=A0A1L5JJ43_PRUAV|nr:alpha carbonic anhydrase 7-like [Prunus avium]XP_021806636.1 alpha carbonic anhydrase 7-like [Prunus avium]APO15268.1 monodehydroascorbate reductase [Prunus avium]
MKPHQSKPISIFSVLLFLVLFSQYSTPVTAQEVEDEREFDYLQGSGKGPKQWGEMKKEWAACKNGGMQSPIDLSSKRVKLIPNLGKLNTAYKPCNATVKNRGHDISIEWVGDAGSLKINGTEYLLKQCHWHSPSEHSINGRRYDMELHMVHLSPDPNVTNKIAVVAALYKIGRSDSFLSKLTRHIKSMTDQKEERSVGIIDPNKIKIPGKSYYRYMGSLTVPPCTEGVIWTINKKIRRVSRDQVKLFRVAVHDYAETNARPVQPLNVREIQVYDQGARSTNN